jgi:hypothetical protein
MGESVVFPYPYWRTFKMMRMKKQQLTARQSETNRVAFCMHAEEKNSTEGCHQLSTFSLTTTVNKTKTLMTRQKKQKQNDKSFIAIPHKI